MKDKYYTPPSLANHLVSFINKKNVISIADFCVGEGELLKAAKEKWSNAKFYGTDISSDVVTLMKKFHQDWILGKCDFLNPKSRNQCPIFKQKFDVILLNPPFTCKGATIETIIIDDIRYNVSTAMAFFVEATKYLKEDGVMYAILPQSIAYSQKDEKIRNYLGEKYSLKIFEERNNQEFGKCTPNIILVSVNDKNLISQNNQAKQVNTGIRGMVLKRGNISMHKISEVKSSLSLIHSTNMHNGKIINLKYTVSNERSRIDGPALLIHRVGQPNIDKICIISQGKAYALSDCVIGITTNTINDCYLLKEIITDNWSDFSGLYKGTGAKYITIERLKYFFNLQY